MCTPPQVRPPEYDGSFGYFYPGVCEPAVDPVLMIRYKFRSLAPCALQCMIKSEMPLMLPAAVVLEMEKTQHVRLEAW